MALCTSFALHHGCKLTSLKPEDIRVMRKVKTIFYNKKEMRGFFSRKIPWISNSSWLGQKEFFLISKEMRRGQSKKCPVMPVFVKTEFTFKMIQLRCLEVRICIQSLHFQCLAMPPVAHACPNIKLLLSSAIILCLFSCLDYYHSSSTTKGTTLHLSRGSNTAMALTNLVQIRLSISKSC